MFRSCLVLCYFVFFFTNYGAVNDFLNYLLFLCFIYLRFRVSFLLFDLCCRLTLIQSVVFVMYSIAEGAKRREEKKKSKRRGSKGKFHVVLRRFLLWLLLLSMSSSSSTLSYSIVL